MEEEKAYGFNVECEMWPLPADSLQLLGMNLFKTIPDMQFVSKHNSATSLIFGCFCLIRVFFCLLLLLLILIVNIVVNMYLFVYLLIHLFFSGHIVNKIICYESDDKISGGCCAIEDISEGRPCLTSVQNTNKKFICRL